MFVFCFSPALVDVDAVDFVSTDCDLGQGLNHMVTLQNYISLTGAQAHSENSHTDTKLPELCWDSVAATFMINL